MSLQALTDATPQAVTWPDDPQPLRRQMPDADPFPLDALPDVLRGAAAVIGETVQAPPALIGQSLIAASALAAQTHVGVQIDGRCYPASCFLVTVAQSGERKSATDELALGPHRKRERDLLDEYRAAQSHYELERSAWDRQKTDALKPKTMDAKRLKMRELEAEPCAPLYPMLTTSEPTFAGLVKGLVTGTPSVGLFSDEGGQFMGGHAMSRDNRLHTAAGLSDVWGGKAIRRTRAEDGQALLYGRRVSLHLMLQPVVAPELFGDDVLTGQGLTARILPAWPHSTIGERPYKASDVQADARYQRYFARLMDVLELAPPLADGHGNGLEPRALELEPAARQRWIAFHDWIEAQCKPSGALRPMVGWAAKGAEHALRLAAVLAFIDQPDTGAISDTAIQRGIALAQFYASEVHRIGQSTADAPEIALAEKAFEWAARAPDGLIALPDLYQLGPSGLRTKANARAAMELLAEHGHAMPMEGRYLINGKQRRDVWRVRA